MADEGLTILVNSQCAQQLRELLEEKGILDKRKRLKKLPDGKIAIPVMANRDEVSHLCNEINICMDIHNEIELQPSKKNNIKTPFDRMLAAVMSLGEERGVNISAFLNEIPNHWERHGNLLLLPEGAFINVIWTKLGDELWTRVAQNFCCTRVARKGTICADGFRSPRVTLLLGNDGWVEHHDNGIRYCYDMTKSMFCAGNITEKLRVAGFDCKGQTIVDLYAGIGYFTLPYLVHAQADHVHACEWNPDSVEALKRNLQINGVTDRCTVHFGDNRKVCPKGIADRVNLGLIPSSEPGWQVACAALKPEGGILHIHCNVTSKHSIDSDASDVLGALNVFEEGLSTDTSVKTDSLNYNMCETDRLSNKKLQHLTNVEQSTGYERKDTADNRTNLCPDKILSKGEMWLAFAENVSKKISILCSDLKKEQWQTNVLHIEHVKSYAPHVDHLVLDLLCKPSLINS